MNLKFHTCRKSILRQSLSVTFAAIACLIVRPLGAQAQSVLPEAQLPPIVLPQARLLLPAAQLPPIVTPQAPALRGIRPVTARPPAGAICPYQLESQINQILQRDAFRSTHWGVQIESIDYPGELYSYNGNDFLIPASNVKLFTTAAALQSASNSVDGPWQGFDAEIETVNRHSDNDYANDVLRRIGGVRGAQAHLAQLGIPPNSYRQVDGSGLSRQNLATPVLMVALLKSMRSTPRYQQFYRSLPTGGVSGTLEGRFVNTVVQGRVHAKTGTLTGVRALSGYLEHPFFGTIVFSILGNQSGGGEALRQGIDDIVVTVGKLYPCS